MNQNELDPWKIAALMLENKLQNLDEENMNIIKRVVMKVPCITSEGEQIVAEAGYEYKLVYFNGLICQIENSLQPQN